MGKEGGAEEEGREEVVGKQNGLIDILIGIVNFEVGL